MNIVLHQPEIPSNTGNIGRTCVATGSSLHLIEPLGFIINDKLLKRAGMDYWDKLKYERYMNYDALRNETPAQGSGLPLQKERKAIRMSGTHPMILLCSEGKAVGSRRTSLRQIPEIA